MSRRNVCFTLNNYTQEEENALKNIECDYIIFGHEVGEENTPHLQGYIEFGFSKKLTALKNFNKRIHWEERKGSAQEASDYCRKQDLNPFVKGNISNQGARSDLQELNKQIVEGKTSVDQIIQEKPDLYHQYGRTLIKCEEIANRKKFRTEMTTCDWYYGSTGVGKSTIAFKDYNPDKVYPWQHDDNGWQDDYVGQETVVINEFRGGIQFGYLLTMIDWTPEVKIRRRNRAPMPFISKHIIITSSMPPWLVYNNLGAEDKLSQLYRRIKIIKINDDHSTTVVCNCNKDFKP